MRRATYGIACVLLAWPLVACTTEAPQSSPATSGAEVDEAAAIEEARKHPVATPPDRPPSPTSTPPPRPERGPPPEPPPQGREPSAAPPATAAPQVQATEAQLVAPQAPPEPYQETRPPPPATEYVWAPGYWYWYGGHYVWIGGAWLPPRYGYGYVGSRWVLSGDGWIYVPGGWAPIGSNVVVYPMHRHRYLHHGHRGHYRQPQRAKRYVHPERGPRVEPNRRDYGRGGYRPSGRGGTSRVRAPSRR